MTPAEFWDATMAEVGAVLEAHARREQEHRARVYDLAQLVWVAFSGKMPPRQEYVVGVPRLSDAERARRDEAAWRDWAATRKASAAVAEGAS